MAGRALVGGEVPAVYTSNILYDNVQYYEYGCHRGVGSWGSQRPWISYGFKVFPGSVVPGQAIGRRVWWGMGGVSVGPSSGDGEGLAGFEEEQGDYLPVEGLAREGRDGHDIGKIV